MMTRRSIMMERTQSFFLKESNSNDKIRIFCFPYAGGGASAYRNWGTYLPDYVGVYPIQIPGREALPQLSVIIVISHVPQLCFKQLPATSSIHCTFYHF